MLKGHYGSNGAHIEYGEASNLFPVAELNATVLQHRDAELALAETSREDVLVVSATSMATGYALGNRPLTAIQVVSLPEGIKGELAEPVDCAIETFDLIQVGMWNSEGPNHSLAEFP